MHGIQGSCVSLTRASCIILMLPLLLALLLLMLLLLRVACRCTIVTAAAWWLRCNWVLLCGAGLTGPVLWVSVVHEAVQRSLIGL